MADTRSVRPYEPESEASWLYQQALAGTANDRGSICGWIANYIIVDEVAKIVEKMATADGYHFHAVGWDDTGTETWLVPRDASSPS